MACHSPSNMPTGNVTRPWEAEDRKGVIVPIEYAPSHATAAALTPEPFMLDIGSLSPARAAPLVVEHPSIVACRLTVNDLTLLKRRSSCTAGGMLVSERR